jgi:ribosomal protein L29
MAEVRTAKPTTVQAAGKKKTAPKQKQPTGIAELRQELGKARRDHRMQQLDSPTKLRNLRKSLARELTKDRAAKLKEANG